MLSYKDFDRIRKQLKLTNQEAAELLGVSRRTLSNYALKSKTNQSVNWKKSMLPTVGAFGVLGAIIGLPTAVNQKLQPRQVKELVSIELEKHGMSAVNMTSDSIAEFLGANLNLLRQISNSVELSPKAQKMLWIVAATSKTTQQHDDEPTLFMKMMLDLKGRQAVVIDSHELQKLIMSGDQETPEPMICIGPPERNYFTLMLGRDIASLPEQVEKRYRKELEKLPDATLCKVAGQAIYIVYAEDQAVSLDATELLTKMLLRGELDIKPGNRSEGDSLPPLELGKRA